jgi:hypothetical protein
MFNFLNFYLEFLKRILSSEPLNTKNASNFFILWHAACMESFLPIRWHTLFEEKNPHKYCATHIPHPFDLTPNRPLQCRYKMFSSGIFWRPVR